MTLTDRQKANTKEEDPTGLLNEGFRYRDLETGVFITKDPAGFVDGPNLYTYVQQNPWTKFDPEGLFFSEIVDVGFFAWDLCSAVTARTPKAKMMAQANLAIDAAGMAIDVADLGTGGGTAALVAGRAALKAKQAAEAVQAAKALSLATHAAQGAEQLADAANDKGGASSGGSPSGDTAKDIVQKEGTAGGDRAGKSFTKKGKDEVKNENAAAHDGQTTCENCQQTTVPGQQSQKGVTPPGNQTEVDHVIAKSKGGDGSPSNGQVLCRDCNQAKSNNATVPKPSTPPPAPPPPPPPANN